LATELQNIDVGRGDHAVHFYDRERELAHVAGRYLIDGLRAGAAAIVLATSAHRREFAAELVEGGVDVEARERDGGLVMLDAATTLEALMPAGRIDRDAFREVIGSLVRRASLRSAEVRAFGEMVGVLWERGDVAAAIELEQLWNELQHELDFSLLCAYRSDLVSGTNMADAVSEVCGLHSAVLSGPPRAELGTRELDDQASARFAADRGAPSEARRFVAEVLRQWGLHNPLLDDARLIVSELATNAVVHAGSPFSVVVRAADSRLRLSVRDASPAEPRIRPQGPMTDRGRGLPLVAALASSWGIEPSEEGKVVWAELAG
jgi:anti-sigma regulatory factor (Ser/Thr protein kinase)